MGEAIITSSPALLLKEKGVKVPLLKERDLG
jgi:hypothetical protein